MIVPEWMKGDGNDSEELLKFGNFLLERVENSTSPEAAKARLWGVVDKIDRALNYDEVVDLMPREVEDAKTILAMYPQCRVKLVKQSPNSPVNPRAILFRRP
jgi:hypothetical protein